MLLLSLVPFLSENFWSEFLITVILLSMPLMYFSWELPLVSSVVFIQDKLSINLCFLSLWMVLIMFLVSKKGSPLLKLTMVFLLLSLISYFSVSSILSFFIMFEMSLIPTLVLILGWGYQPERIEASFYFFFYTFLFSMPLLTSLLWLLKVSGSKFLFPEFSSFTISNELISLLILLVFMVKLPLFSLHFWLPKAHVEAPLVGSIILASVLLKTGGYGVIRFYLHVYSSLTMWAFFSLGLVGMFYICMICLYSVDLKQLIAYSSISHMNFLALGLTNESSLSTSGSTFLMMSHGLSSSLMFFMVDCNYQRSFSRSILLNKGVLMTFPTISLCWGFSFLVNVSLPPTLGSLGELTIIMSLSNLGLLVSSVVFFYLLLSAFYSMYLYILVNHGLSKNPFQGKAMTLKELLISFLHFFPLILLLMFNKVMMV